MDLPVPTIIKLWQRMIDKLLAYVASVQCMLYRHAVWFDVRGSPSSELTFGKEMAAVCSDFFLKGLPDSLSSGFVSETQTASLKLQLSSSPASAQI